MSTNESFKTDSKFKAVDYFPYGISRSGEFTIQQAELLEKHGYAYQSLHTGEREPVNEEERRFVAVCHGELKAETAHEQAWRRFCEKTTKKRTIITLASRSKHKISSDTASNSDESY